MPAYVIVVAKIHDRPAFLEGYAKAAAELVAPLEVRYLLKAPGAVALEGGWGEGASVLVEEWPDRETVEAHWRSPAYAEICKLREGISEMMIWMVEGPRIEG